MTKAKKVNWQAEDEQFEQEFGTVLKVVRSLEPLIQVPRSVNRKVRRLARERVSEQIEDSWLLGQGPRMILVTCILFAIASMVILSKL